MLEEDIRRQTRRLSIALATLLGLAVWQADFAWTAFQSNVYLNGTILVTFLFGVTRIYRDQRRLKNELVMLAALREELDDTRPNPFLDESNPHWRQERCERPAIVFRATGILEQAYRLCSEKIRQSGCLSVSSNTLHNLIDGVNARADAQRAMPLYISGTLILLGLIGTFIGLMQTLASVGKILGDLDLSSQASAEVIANLITNLQIPLSGMATGFSSSLFGLLTSLTLGVMARFAHLASDAVRHEFEGWLSALAEIESTEPAGAGKAKPGAEDDIDRKDLRLLFRAARNAVLATANLTDRTGELAGHIAALSRQQSHQQERLSELANEFRTATEAQAFLARSVDKVADTLATQEKLSLMLTDFHRRTGEQMQAIGERLDNLARQAAKSGHETARQEEMNNEMEALARQIRASLGEHRHFIAQANMEGIRTENALKLLSGGFKSQTLQLERLREAIEAHVPRKGEPDPERESLVRQLDHMIAIHRLSAEDERTLKDLAAFAREFRAPIESLRAHFTSEAAACEPTGSADSADADSVGDAGVAPEKTAKKAAPALAGPPPEKNTEDSIEGWLTDEETFLEVNAGETPPAARGGDSGRESE